MFEHDDPQFSSVPQGCTSVEITVRYGHGEILSHVVRCMRFAFGFEQSPLERHCQFSGQQFPSGPLEALQGASGSTEGSPLG